MSRSVRLLDPCDDGSCDWQVNPINAMTTERWYPAVYALSSILINSRPIKSHPLTEKHCQMEA